MIRAALTLLPCFVAEENLQSIIPIPAESFQLLYIELKGMEDTLAVTDL